MAKAVYPEALDISRDCEIIDVKLVICTYLLAKFKAVARMTNVWLFYAMTFFVWSSNADQG